jgi:hypothetical protein
MSEADELDQNARLDTELPVYEGAMPGSFTVHQRLRQWSPRITRETTFGADPSLLAETTIDWNALPVEALNDTEGRRTLFAKVLAGEPGAQVLLLHEGWTYSPTWNQAAPVSAATPGSSLSRNIPESGNQSRWPSTPFASLAGSGLLSPAVQSASPVVSLAVRASVRPATGVFSLFSQIAPTGGQIFEDLALLDDDNPAQWLLIVVVRRENAWIVYRRLLDGISSPGGG